MITNIDAQLEDLLCDLTPYWNEIQHQRTEVITLMFKKPLMAFTGSTRLIQVLGRSRKDVLSGRGSPGLREVIDSMLAAPATEQQRQVRADLAGDFSIHVIAERLVTQHPVFDFAAIRKLHESRRADRLKLTTKQFFAIALTFTAFIGKTVPEVVLKDLGWSKAEFDRSVFYGTCGLLIYVGLLVFVEWQGIRRDIAKHEFFARILSYTELCVPKAKG